MLSHRYFQSISNGCIDGLVQDCNNSNTKALELPVLHYSINLFRALIPCPSILWFKRTGKHFFGMPIKFTPVLPVAPICFWYVLKLSVLNCWLKNCIILKQKFFYIQFYSLQGAGLWICVSILILSFPTSRTASVGGVSEGRIWARAGQACSWRGEDLARWPAAGRATEAAIRGQGVRGR